MHKNFASISVVSFNFLLCLSVFAQKEVPLYANGKIPNSLSGAKMPVMKVYNPNLDRKTNTAIIICSGGAYHQIADFWEGTPAAELFSKEGFTIFLLDYRIPNIEMMPNKAIGPIQDLQTAIKYVREHAKEYGVAKDHVGVMGFSAGGHLVTTAGTHFDRSYIDNENETSLRPDFMVLVYPVISLMDDLTDISSRNQLIGPAIKFNEIVEYSNDLHVNGQTPPAFITVSLDDDIVKPTNSFDFAAELEQANVEVRLFVYKRGGHAFGVINRTVAVQWTQSCIDWLKGGKWLRK